MKKGIVVIMVYVLLYSSGTSQDNLRSNEKKLGIAYRVHSVASWQFCRNKSIDFAQVTGDCN